MARRGLVIDRVCQSLSGDGHILAVGADTDFRVFRVLVQDSDEDEVADSSDAFSNDPAASLDTDGDTLPDDWNAGATAEQIADSSLMMTTTIMTVSLTYKRWPLA